MSRLRPPSSATPTAQGRHGAPTRKFVERSSAGRSRRKRSSHRASRIDRSSFFRRPSPRRSASCLGPSSPRFARTAPTSAASASRSRRPGGRARFLRRPAIVLRSRGIRVAIRRPVLLPRPLPRATVRGSRGPRGGVLRPPSPRDAPLGSVGGGGDAARGRIARRYTVPRSRCGTAADKGGIRRARGVRIPSRAVVLSSRCHGGAEDAVGSADGARRLRPPPSPPVADALIASPAKTPRGMRPCLSSPPRSLGTEEAVGGQWAGKSSQFHLVKILRSSARFVGRPFRSIFGRWATRDGANLK